MIDTCNRIADETYEMFVHARKDLREEATDTGNYGSSRYFLAVDGARKDHFKDGLKTMAERVLTEAGKVTRKGIVAIRTGGERLRDRLIDALETELSVAAAYAGALGPTRQQAAVDAMRRQLDDLLEAAIDNATQGFAGGKLVLEKSPSRLKTWVAGIGFNFAPTVIWAFIAAAVFAGILKFVYWWFYS